jgi:hypothetical protein
VVLTPVVSLLLENLLFGLAFLGRYLKKSSIDGKQYLDYL